MPVPIVYWLLVFVVLHIISQRTTFGRYVVAVGLNKRVAKLSDIPVNRVKHRAYALMGTLVAFPTVLRAPRIGSMDYANADNDYETGVVAMTIADGTNIAGGCGSVPGIVLGVLTTFVMNSLSNLMGVLPFLREARKGTIVIGAILLQKKESTP